MRRLDAVPHGYLGGGLYASRKVKKETSAWGGAPGRERVREGKGVGRERWLKEGGGGGRGEGKEDEGGASLC